MVLASIGKEIIDNSSQSSDSGDLTNNSDKIVSFYIGEEPTWNGISGVELQAACDYVDTQFPEIAISIVEAFPAVNDLEVPASADWVGFDHYFVKNPVTDSSYQAELDIIQGKMNSD